MFRSKRELRAARRLRRTIAFALVGSIVVFLGMGLVAAIRPAESASCVSAVCETTR